MFSRIVSREDQGQVGLYDVKQSGSTRSDPKYYPRKEADGIYGVLALRYPR